MSYYCCRCSFRYAVLSITGAILLIGGIIAAILIPLLTISKTKITTSKTTTTTSKTTTTTSKTTTTTVTRNIHFSYRFQSIFSVDDESYVRSLSSKKKHNANHFQTWGYDTISFSKIKWIKKCFYSIIGCTSMESSRYYCSWYHKFTRYRI